MFRHVAAAAALGLGALACASPAVAQQQCMTHDEMREFVGAGRAVPPAAATRSAREVAPGELVRIRLCRSEDRMIYHITTLRRDGRVAHVTIDGASGKVAEVR
jgi:uncharacterized membrane protein YkoI